MLERVSDRKRKTAEPWVSGSLHEEDELDLGRRVKMRNDFIKQLLF